MVTVTEINGMTGAILFGPIKRKTIIAGIDLAKELLSNHLVEFDQIESVKKRGKEIFSIRHFDGSYAPFEVLVEK